MQCSAVRGTITMDFMASFLQACQQVIVLVSVQWQLMEDNVKSLAAQDVERIYWSIAR